MSPAQALVWDSELQIQKMAQDGVKCDLHFEAGEKSSTAVVDAQSEADVANGLAGDVESVGTRKLALVAIGGTDADDDAFSSGNHNAADLGGAPAVHKPRSITVRGSSLELAFFCDFWLRLYSFTRWPFASLLFS